MDLPDEMIIKTCKEMDISTLLNYIQTNKKMKELCEPIFRRKLKKYISQNYDNYLDSIYQNINQGDAYYNELLYLLQGIYEINPKLLKRMINRKDDIQLGSPMIFAIQCLNDDTEEKIYVKIIKKLIDYGGNISNLIEDIYYTKPRVIPYLNDIIKYANIKVSLPDLIELQRSILLTENVLLNYLKFIRKGLKDGIFKITKYDKQAELVREALPPKQYYKDIINETENQKMIKIIRDILIYL
jgi:hypothetical protein